MINKLNECTPEAIFFGVNCQRSRCFWLLMQARNRPNIGIIPRAYQGKLYLFGHSILSVVMNLVFQIITVDTRGAATSAQSCWN